MSVVRPGIMFDLISFMAQYNHYSHCSSIISEFKFNSPFKVSEAVWNGAALNHPSHPLAKISCGFTFIRDISFIIFKNP